MARSTTSSLYPSPPINRLQRGNVVLKVALSNAAAGAKQPNMCCPPTGGATRLFIAGNSF
jgi:hypothetical protein